MPAKPVIIHREQMVKVLSSGKRAPRFETGEGGQLVAIWDVQKNGAVTGLEVKVYTSIFGECSRGVGEDSIRVALVDPEEDKGLGRTTYTTRTEGWEARLIEKIRAMFDLASTIPYCSCGRRMTLRQARATGNRFWGCTGYAVGACKSTKPYVEPA